MPPSNPSNVRRIMAVNYILNPDNASIQTGPPHIPASNTVLDALAVIDLTEDDAAPVTKTSALTGVGATLPKTPTIDPTTDGNGMAVANAAVRRELSGPTRLRLGPTNERRRQPEVSQPRIPRPEVSHPSAELRRANNEVFVESRGELDRVKHTSDEEVFHSHEPRHRVTATGREASENKPEDWSADIPVRNEEMAERSPERRVITAPAPHQTYGPVPTGSSYHQAQQPNQRAVTAPNLHAGQRKMPGPSRQSQQAPRQDHIIPALRTNDRYAPYDNARRAQPATRPKITDPALQVRQGGMLNESAWRTQQGFVRVEAMHVQQAPPNYQQGQDHQHGQGYQQVQDSSRTHEREPEADSYADRPRCALPINHRLPSPPLVHVRDDQENGITIVTTQGVESALIDNLPYTPQELEQLRRDQGSLWGTGHWVSLSDLAWRKLEGIAPYYFTDNAVQPTQQPAPRPARRQQPQPEPRKPPRSMPQRHHPDAVEIDEDDEEGYNNPPVAHPTQALITRPHPPPSPIWAIPPPQFLMYPPYARGDTAAMEMARRIIDENLTDKPACRQCARRGITCYRGRHPNFRRCAFCQTKELAGWKHCVIGGA